MLWQDCRGARESSRWTALLPVLTERAFVGGLDDGAGIEHATSGLLDDVRADLDEQGIGERAGEPDRSRLPVTGQVEP